MPAPSLFFPRVARSVRARVRRALPFLGFAVLLLTAALAFGSPRGAAEGFSGSFELGPQPLAPGTPGGSELTVGTGGTEATLQLWATPGVPTYFLDVVQFEVEATRATTVSVSAGLQGLPSAIPAGGEVLAEFGSPSETGLPGGYLSSLPSHAEGPLRTIAGMGGAEGGFPGLATGVEENATGSLPLENASTTSSVTLSFPGAGSYDLVLSVGVALPVSATGDAESAVLIVTVSLAPGP